MAQAGPQCSSAALGLTGKPRAAEKFDGALAYYRL